MASPFQIMGHDSVYEPWATLFIIICDGRPTWRPYMRTAGRPLGVPYKGVPYKGVPYD